MALKVTTLTHEEVEGLADVLARRLVTKYGFCQHNLCSHAWDAIWTVYIRRVVRRGRWNLRGACDAVDRWIEQNMTNIS